MTYSPYHTNPQFSSPHHMAQYYNLPTMNPYSESLADCPEGTIRANNYFKECAGVLYICRDACFDPLRNHYEGIGPWKSCGVCVGFPTTST